MFPLTVKSISDEKELRNLREFLLLQPQMYPNYNKWVDSKCIPRIEAGENRSFVAFADDRIIGDAVYRFNSDGSVEIKNFRIDSQYRNRDLGHFILSQVFREAGSKNITLDVSVSNFLGVEFFIRNGFKISEMAELYLPNQLEYIMQRTINIPTLNARNE